MFPTPIREGNKKDKEVNMPRPSANTKEGKRAAKKWRKTMIDRYGKEGFKEMLSESGRKGGKASNNGGFASDKVGADGLTGKQRARIAGYKGGRISRRGPVKEN